MYAHHEISSMADNGQDSLQPRPLVGHVTQPICSLADAPPYRPDTFCRPQKRRKPPKRFRADQQKDYPRTSPLDLRREWRHRLEAQCDFATHEKWLHPPLLLPRDGGRGIPARFITGLPVDATQPDHEPVGPSPKQGSRPQPDVIVFFYI